MADVNYPNTTQVVTDWSNEFASQVRGNLDAKQTRVAIRAKWKKVGEGWTPTSFRIQKIRANFRASGNLINSVKPYVNSISDFGIQVADYGEHIRRGRKPMGANAGGKGIPVQTMENWTSVRRIRPVDPVTGMFVKITPQSKKAMNFLMNRKIKHFGIQAYDFIDHSTPYVVEKYNPRFETALGQDIDLLIQSQIDKSNQKTKKKSS